MKSIVPLILIAVSIAVFVFFTDGVYQDIQAISAQKADYDSALSRSRDVLTKRDQLAQQYKQFSGNDLDAIQKLLPDHVDNIQLIFDLNAIAQSKGITLKGIKITEEKVSTDSSLGPNSKPYASILVSFKATASYENFLDFLNQVEQSLRLVDVTSLSFKANDKDSYDINASVRTYWLKQ